jgi:hypothetical protein
MSSNQSGAPDPPTTLRLWPGIVMAVMLVLVWVIFPVAAPEAEIFGFPGGLAAVIGGMLLAAAIVTWWAFFSRAPWADRLGGIALMIVALVATRPLTHPSIQNGMMGMMLVIYAVPVLAIALVVSAAAVRRRSRGPRRVVITAAILLSAAAFTSIRTNGILGGGSDFAWRWTPTAEERLLARSNDEPALPATVQPPAVPPSSEVAGEPVAAAATGETSSAPPPAASREPAREIERHRADAQTVEPVPTAAHAAAEWPGFRGPGRDGVIRGVRIDADWTASPPVEMWRRAIGPGWSSFAVRGDLLYTQEQRGDDEIVACYKVSTGEPVWRHRDPVRFWESNGGAGPRATPTLGNGLVYTFGATGMVNALDASTGVVAWSRNAATDTGRAIPDWGFASSPLVVDDIVIIAVAGTLVGYDAATGKQRWSGPSYGGSYSSPHRVTIDGVLQVVLLGGPGAISVAPTDGAVLWTHDWSPGPIVQPAMTADGDLLINAVAGSGGTGTRRLHLAQASGGWTVEERWTSNGLKPYFNDFVVHNGHAFGFDGSILASIDLENGRRTWKGGRFGNGQLVLLPDQDLLLVLSEEGELALVSATPDQFRELARFPALDAKTWNHPVLVGDILLVRNGEEMAAFRLALAHR